MCDHTTGLPDRIFGLIHDRVWSVLRISYKDRLLRCDSDSAQGEKPDKKVAEGQELHGVCYSVVALFQQRRQSEILYSVLAEDEEEQGLLVEKLITEHYDVYYMCTT